MAPTWSFWSLPCAKYDHAVVLALWLNSTFALSDLLKRRTEVRDTNTKWTKKEIEDLPVVSAPSMAAKDIDDAKSLLHELGQLKFPCLIEQLETAYEGRVMLDNYFVKLLHMNIPESKIIDLQ
jgi:hypothetical protein